MSDLELTTDEAKVVLSLLNLYDEAWEKGRCRAYCACAYCMALEEAGEHQAAVFDSLKEKARKAAA